MDKRGRNTDKKEDSMLQRNLLVSVQSNGMIRRKDDDIVIGRLVDDMTFEELFAPPMERMGRFFMPLDTLLSHKKEVEKLFQTLGFVPFRVRQDKQTMQVDYIGTSNEFDLIIEGTATPVYNLIQERIKGKLVLRLEKAERRKNV